MTRSAMRSAMAMGLMRIWRASLRGRLDAKSPCSAFCGLSTAASTPSAGGSAPASWASARAACTMRPISSLIVMVRTTYQTMR